MAIKMRRGNKNDLDRSKLVAGEIAVCLDEDEVYVSQGNGDTIELATKDDLENIIAIKGGIRVDDEDLIFYPEED